MSSVKYTGHVGNGGLQGHSVGALYPYVVYGQETPAGLRYGVMNGTKDADTGPIFRECKAAYAAAEELKSGESTVESLFAALEVRKEWLRHVVPAAAMEVLV
jgi:hypothetical protein